MTGVRWTTWLAFATAAWLGAGAAGAAEAPMTAEAVSKLLEEAKGSDPDKAEAAFHKLIAAGGEAKKAAQTAAKELLKTHGRKWDDAAWRPGRDR